MRVSVLASLVLLLVVIGAFRLRIPDRTWTRRACIGGAALIGLVAVGLTATAVLKSPYREWNDPRLAATAAVLAGHDLYSPRDEGPLTGHIYGPVSPLVFAPALLMPTPGRAIALGALLAFALVAAPGFMILAQQAQGHGLPLALAFLAFWTYLLGSEILAFTSFLVHADAPALGFSALACAFVLSKQRRERPIFLGASALAAVLGVGSKQVMVPLLIVLPLWIGLVDGWRSLRRYLLIAVGVGLATLLVVAALVDFPNMVFNSIIVPANHPLKPQTALALIVRATRDLAPRMFPFVMILGLVGALDRSGPDGWQRAPRRWLANNSWTLLALLSLACVPLAVLGRSVVGGAINALAYPLYFVLLAALMALVRTSRRPDSVWGVSSGPAMIFVLTLMAATPAVFHAPDLARLPEVKHSFDANPEDQIFEFVKGHPGEVYLPFKPLVTLMAEGAAYHFSYGVRDRALAGMPVSGRHFRQHLPARLRYVGLYEVGTDRYHAMSYLPEFVNEVGFAELPGWRLLTAAAGEVDTAR